MLILKLAIEWNAERCMVLERLSHPASCPAPRGGALGRLWAIHLTV